MEHHDGGAPDASAQSIASEIEAVLVAALVVIVYGVSIVLVLLHT